MSPYLSSVPGSSMNEGFTPISKDPQFTCPLSLCFCSWLCLPTTGSLLSQMLSQHVFSSTVGKAVSFSSQICTWKEYCSLRHWSPHSGCPKIFFLNVFIFPLKTLSFQPPMIRLFIVCKMKLLPLSGYLPRSPSERPLGN